jgi:hypothetical protein
MTPGSKPGGHAPANDGELAAAISNVVVKALASTTGRGPTKAKTTLGENSVFVVLQDTMTRGERSLFEAGEHEVVLGVRRKWQQVMQADQPRRRGAQRARGDRLHERQPSRSRPRGRGVRAEAARAGR